MYHRKLLTVITRTSIVPTMTRPHRPSSPERLPSPSHPTSRAHTTRPGRTHAGRRGTHAPCHLPAVNGQAGGGPLEAWPSLEPEDGGHGRCWIWHDCTSLGPGRVRAGDGEVRHCLGPPGAGKGRGRARAGAGRARAERASRVAREWRHHWQDGGGGRSPNQTRASRVDT